MPQASLSRVPREVIQALLRREPAAFVPSHECVLASTVRAWGNQGAPLQADGQVADPAELFDFDMLPAGGEIDWEPHLDCDEVVAETAAWQVVRNGAGAVMKWQKDGGGVPEQLAFTMTGRESWERDYKPALLATDPRLRIRVKSTARELARCRAAGKWAYFGNPFIWECLRASLGDVKMLLALMDEPAWIHDLNRTYTELFKACYRLLFAEAGLPDGIWLREDLAFRDRLFCRPETLAELFFPYYREMVDFFHGYGLPVLFHSCGYQAPLLPLIVEAGFDALNPMEVKAGNDIFAYAEQYGESLLFVGGLDARILESNDPAQIRRGVTDFMLGMKARNARFLFGSDHSVPPTVTYPSFQLAMAVYRELREPTAKAPRTVRNRWKTGRSVSR